ncbi:MAG: cytochrome P450 [Acidimicrobiia bacterium]
MIALKREQPGDDFFSLLLESELDGRHLTSNEVERFATVLLIAGHETTSKAMSMSLHFLAHHPHQRRELFGQPTLFPQAVEELLRLFPPILLFGRNSTHDLELGGVSIREGDVVALGYGPANRDPNVFHDPHSARFNRDPNPHLTFGQGPHLCVGAHLARLEMTVMLERFRRCSPTSVSTLPVPSSGGAWRPTRSPHAPRLYRIVTTYVVLRFRSWGPT